MKLNFLGNGSGFSKSHNGAFFLRDNSFYLIDCSLLNLEKILSLRPNNYRNIYVIITHMHDDHVSGLSLFIQKMFYVYGKMVKIVCPIELENDINEDLKIKGLSKEMYEIVYPNKLGIKEIPTTHTPQLEGKCFGYAFTLDDKNIVYSGDTNTIEPFYPYLDEDSEFYVDASVTGVVHVKYDDVEEELSNIASLLDVYLMHMDDEEYLKERISDTNIKIAYIYGEEKEERRK